MGLRNLFKREKAANENVDEFDYLQNRAIKRMASEVATEMLELHNKKITHIRTFLDAVEKGDKGCRAEIEREIFDVSLLLAVMKLSQRLSSAAFHMYAEVPDARSMQILHDSLCRNALLARLLVMVKEAVKESKTTG